MDINEATEDENIPFGHITNHEELGRQVKISSQVNNLPVTDSDVGDRATRMVGIAGNPDPNGLIAAVTAGINAACLPGGAISNCVTNAITAACQPGGAILELINNSMKIQDCKYLNSAVSSRSGSLTAVPSTAGLLPPNFSLTLGDVWTLQAADLNALLNFYQIPVIGNLQQRRSSLAKVLRLRYPID